MLPVGAFMRRVLSLAFPVLQLLTLLLLAGQLQAAEYDPLFASAAKLQITLDGPFGLIDRERDKEKDYPGKLSYQSPTGEPVVLDVEFQVRGNYRLRKENCGHAQLWLNIKTRQAQDTLFENQDRIKLVVQCGSEQRYADYLVREHQAYQFFNRLTDRSIAARLVDVTYRDSSDPHEARTSLGMFIEHQKRLAKRLDLQGVKVDRIGVAQLEPVQASLVAIYNYMVANADYSMLAADEGEECCHNVIPLEDQEGRYVPIPYDFDSSGFVNASYATPPAGLNLRSVRQRLYRGFCAHNDLITATLAHFREHRQAFETILADTTQVSSSQAERAQQFIKGFYDLIDDPANIQREFLGKCR